MSGEDSKNDNVTVLGLASAIISKINNLISSHNSDTSAHSDKESISNKVSSWSSTPTNAHYPSEKLVQDTIENERIYNVNKTFTGAIEDTYYQVHDNINPMGDIYDYPFLLGENAELTINITTAWANNEGIGFYGYNLSYLLISDGTNIIFYVDDMEMELPFDIPNNNCTINLKTISNDYGRYNILMTCTSNNTTIGQYTIDDGPEEGLYYYSVNIPLVGTYKYTIPFFNKYELETINYNTYENENFLDYYATSNYNASGTWIEYDITFTEGDELDIDTIEQYSPKFKYENGYIKCLIYYYDDSQNNYVQETITLKHSNSCKIIEYCEGNKRRYIFDSFLLDEYEFGTGYNIRCNLSNENPNPNTELIVNIYQPIKIKYIGDLANDMNVLTQNDIADNLTTSYSWKTLSAKQGKILNDNKLDKSQTSYKGKNVVVDATTGNITFEDKPTIPTKTSDLTNDSGFLTSHQSLSGYLQTSDVKNNLTSTDIDKPLSANQGKELKALIDNKEDNIYRIVGTEASSISSSSARLHCGTFPFDNINSRLIVYVVPDISTLSESQRAIIYGSYPSGGTISHNIFKSNNEYLTIGDIQTGDELLLMHEDKWRVISNSSISNKEDKSNKSSSITTDTGSTTKYPTVKAVEDYAQPIGNYLTSHQDISGKLDKAQTSYKGKNVVVDSTSGNITFEDKPTIPSASSTIPSADTTNGAIGLGTTWAKADHQHPKSSIYAEASHSHTKSEISDFPTLANVATSGSYADLSNKPTLSSLGGTVTVEEQQTAESGFTKTYVVKQNGSQVGSKINIPKDFLVKSATVQTVTTTNTPVNGYVSGDKYLDFIINSKDGTAADEHLYVLVSDLVDTEIDWANVQNKPTFFDGNYNSLTNKPSIPSVSSDLSDGSDLVKKSSTTGLLKNDGSVMSSGTGSSNWAVGNHTHTTSDITNMPTVPSASSTTPSADTENGSVGTGTTWARSNHTHPKSSLYAESSHTHSDADITTVGFYSNLPQANYGSPSQQQVNFAINSAMGGKEDTSNKVSSWSSTTNNIRYPTEKLVKDSLDIKLTFSDLYFYYDESSDELVLSLTPSVYTGNYLLYDLGSINGLSNYGSSECVRGSNATMTMEYDTDENAYKVYGSGNYHSFIPIPILDDKDNYTIEAEVKGQNIQYNCIGFFLDNRNDNTSYGLDYGLQVYHKRLHSGKYRLSSDGGEDNVTISTITANTWYKIKFTVDGNNLTGTLYDKNNNLLGTKTRTLSINNKRMGIFLFCETGTNDSVCYIRNIKAMPKYLFEDSCSSSNNLTSYGTVKKLWANTTTGTIQYNSTENAYQLDRTGSSSNSDQTIMFPISSLENKDYFTFEADIKSQHIAYNRIGFGCKDSNGECAFVSLGHDTWSSSWRWFIGNESGLICPTESSYTFTETWYHMKMEVEEDNYVCSIYDMNDNLLTSLTGTTTNVDTSAREWGIILGCPSNSTAYIKNIEVTPNEY